MKKDDITPTVCPFLYEAHQADIKSDLKHKR